MKQAVATAIVFALHVALFTLIYYGRRQGIAACQSEAFLFGLPFVLASSAYAAVWASLFHTRRTASRICLAGVVAVCAALASALAGMTLAFNLMGT